MNVNANKRKKNSRENKKKKPKNFYRRNKNWNDWRLFGWRKLGN